MAVKITCYGSVEEIGGNKIMVEDAGTRFLLDFGTAFGQQGRFFNEFLRPRSSRGLHDLLALGLLPPLEGLYREDLAFPGLWERMRNHPNYRSLEREGEPAVDGIIVSHAHLDHIGDVSYLDPRIPIYTSRTSAFVARVMQITGPSSFERELVFASPRRLSETGNLQIDRRCPYQGRSFAFLDGELSPSAQQFWDEAPSQARPLEMAVQHASPESINGLPLRWWPVDHSIPGAVGVAIKTSAGWIGYTGDIRYHGVGGKNTQRFAQELAQLEPVAVLCEATHQAHTNPLTEADVIVNALQLVREAAGRLVIADFGPRNVERLVSFLRIAQRTGRTLVVLPKHIYLLQAISLADPSCFPDPTQVPHLAVYDDPKAAPRVWEKAVRKNWEHRTVDAHDVSKTPGDYILCFNLWDANDLLDLDLARVRGGAYLYSGSRAYDDEQQADLDRLRSWADLMGLTLHGDPDDPQAVPLHSPGHAPGPHLVDFVKTVSPKVLIPIHTEQPDWWRGQLAETDIHIEPPRLGQAITL